jgi:hypothetical protein
MLGAFGDSASGRQWAPLLRLKTCYPEGHDQLIELGNTHERRGSDLDPDRGSLSVESTRTMAQFGPRSPWEARL